MLTYRGITPHDDMKYVNITTYIIATNLEDQ